MRPVRQASVCPGVHQSHRGRRAGPGTLPGIPPSEDAAGNHGTGAKPALGRFEANLEHHLAQMEPLLKRYGYAAIFLAVLVEGVGILAPGQTLLVVGAIAAARGEFKIVWVLACALVAAVLGNSLGYLLGRWGGRPLLGKLKVSKNHLQPPGGIFYSPRQMGRAHGPLCRRSQAAQRPGCRYDENALEGFHGL